MSSLKIATFVLLFLSVPIQLCLSLSALRSSDTLKASGQTATTIVDHINPITRKQVAAVFYFNPIPKDENTPWLPCSPPDAYDRRDGLKKNVPIVWEYLKQFPTEAELYPQGALYDGNSARADAAAPYDTRPEMNALYKEIQSLVYRTAKAKLGRTPTGEELYKHGEAARISLDSCWSSAIRQSHSEAAMNVLKDTHFILRESVSRFEAMRQLALGTEEEFLSTLASKALNEPWTPLTLFAAKVVRDPNYEFGSAEEARRLNELLLNAAHQDLEVLGVESKEQKHKVITRIQAFIEAHRQRIQPAALALLNKLAISFLAN